MAAVISGPDAKRRASAWLLARILTWVPPTSTTRTCIPLFRIVPTSSLLDWTVEYTAGADVLNLRIVEAATKRLDMDCVHGLPRLCLSAELMWTARGLDALSQAC